MNEPFDDLNPLEPAEHAAQLAAVLERSVGVSSAVDLGTGNGRVAIPLSLHTGSSVLAVDRDPSVFAHAGWVEAAAVEHLEEDFLGTDSNWYRRGPFELALCLGNTLSLLLEHQQLDMLFGRLDEALLPGGSFLVDDFPVWGWEAVQAGDWPSGVNEDGSAQILWVPGEPIFAFRTGAEVAPDSDQLHPEERLLRLWSLSELRFLAERRGLRGPFHHSEGHLLEFRRP